MDLCGIAKGFAVDQVALALERLGVGSYLVEVGGELRGAGVKPDGEPWWVELEAPSPAASIPRTVVALHGHSVATSGGYQRFFDHDGRRFTHTLNPVEGRPVREQIVSVSVLHRDCMVADAMATALIVMGVERARDFVESNGIAARFLSRLPNGNGAEDVYSSAMTEMLA